MEAQAAATTAQAPRLTPQPQHPATEPGGGAQRPRQALNRLDPYALNEIDQRMLREAFRQARVLQTHLDQAVGH